MSSKRTFELKLRDSKNQPYGDLGQEPSRQKGQKMQKPQWWVSRLGRVPGTERKRERERQGQAAQG